jgi:DnaJ like chaperone protein
MFCGWQGNVGGGSYSSSSTGYRSTYNNIENDYKILEINANASDEEVKKAYRKEAMKHHPDKVNHLGDDIRKAAEERFAKLNESYERIKKVRGMN